MSRDLSAVLGFEERLHEHAGRLTTAELRRHLKQPHRQPDGRWCSLATQPRGWSREELDREHDRFHGQT